jgi:hypothetical protein
MELPHSVRSRFENVSRSQKTVDIVALHQDAIQRSLDFGGNFSGAHSDEPRYGCGFVSTACRLYVHKAFASFVDCF